MDPVWSIYEVDPSISLRILLKLFLKKCQNAVHVFTINALLLTLTCTDWWRNYPTNSEEHCIRNYQDLKSMNDGPWEKKSVNGLLELSIVECQGTYHLHSRSVTNWSSSKLSSKTSSIKFKNPKFPVAIMFSWRNTFEHTKHENLKLLGGVRSSEQ